MATMVMDMLMDRLNFTTVGASPVYINFPNIYKIVVCNTQNKDKDVSFSRKEGAKVMRVVAWFTMLAIDTNISNFNPTSFSLKPFINLLMYSSRKDCWKTKYTKCKRWCKE